MLLALVVVIIFAYEVLVAELMGKVTGIGVPVPEAEAVVEEPLPPPLPLPPPFFLSTTADTTWPAVLVTILTRAPSAPYSYVFWVRPCPICFALPATSVMLSC